MTKNQQLATIHIITIRHLKSQVPYFLEDGLYL